MTIIDHLFTKQHLDLWSASTEQSRRESVRLRAQLSERHGVEPEGEHHQFFEVLGDTYRNMPMQGFHALIEDLGFQRGLDEKECKPTASVYYNRERGLVLEVIGEGLLAMVRLSGEVVSQGADPASLDEIVEVLASMEENQFDKMRIRAQLGEGYGFSVLVTNGMSNKLALLEQTGVTFNKVWTRKRSTPIPWFIVDGPNLFHNLPKEGRFDWKKTFDFVYARLDLPLQDMMRRSFE